MFLGEVTQHNDLENYSVENQVGVESVGGVEEKSRNVWLTGWAVIVGEVTQHNDLENNTLKNQVGVESVRCRGKEWERMVNRAGCVGWRGDSARGP